MYGDFSFADLLSLAKIYPLRTQCTSETKAKLDCKPRNGSPGGFTVKTYRQALPATEKEDADYYRLYMSP